MKLKLIVVPLFALLLSSCVSLLMPNVEPVVDKLKAGDYVLDKAHASLLFKISHMGLSSYVGRFNQFDATLEFDPSNIVESKLDALIEIDSLDLNDDDLKRDLMRKKWFDQVQYPYAKFSTTSVTPVENSDNAYDYTGELDWRGVQKDITIRVIFNGGATNILTQKYTLGFTAFGSFLRSDFGMGAYIPLVGDEVKIEAFAEFQKQ